MRFSRTNMRLAAARLPDLSRKIDAQAAEFSITHFCPRNPGLTKSTTYARETAKIGRSLFKSSLSSRMSEAWRLAAMPTAAYARFPSGLRQWLQDPAGREHRSISCRGGL